MKKNPKIEAKGEFIRKKISSHALHDGNFEIFYTKSEKICSRLCDIAFVAWAYVAYRLCAFF